MSCLVFRQGVRSYLSRSSLLSAQLAGGSAAA
jgi:hypothetical protein